VTSPQTGRAPPKAAKKYVDGYLTKPAPETLRGILNAPRGAGQVVPLPHNWFAQQREISAIMLHQFGLSEYWPQANFEKKKIPVPQVFRSSDVDELTALVVKWLPLLLRKWFVTSHVPIQTYKKTSRLGAPFFYCPELPKNGGHSKKEVLAPEFQSMRTHGAGNYIRNYPARLDVIMNRRLQAESLRKERQFQYVDAEGRVYDDVWDEVARRGLDGGGKTSHSMRPRLVFNLPVTNLFKQPVDTMLHHAQLTFPVFHHDMYSPGGSRIPTGYALAMDVKHFERATARIVYERARLIGGAYWEIAQATRELPFLVTSDDMRSLFRIWPNYAAGWEVQYASGDSAVSPAQKDILAAIFCEFRVQEANCSPEAALDWVLHGGDDTLMIMNYGDDNVFGGDQRRVEALYSFCGRYLHVEREPTVKFLGFTLCAEGWKLTPTSYLLKTYLNERNAVDKRTEKLGTAFRRLPSFGWVEKRKGYSLFGTRELRTAVFPAEDEALKHINYPWSAVMQEAVKEAATLGNEPNPFQSMPFLHGKDYLLSPEQQLALGLVDAADKPEVYADLRLLLDPEWFALISQ
jgi:hypothetical protein